MTRAIYLLLTLLFSLSGPAMGKYSDFDRSSVAARGTQGLVDVTSKPRTVEAALTTGQKWLKPGYSELGKPGSGVYRSADGLRQFRMTDADIAGIHGGKPVKIGPHVHFEKFAPTGEKLKNIHTPLIDP
jgi:hypothetical protein